jgi:hypothetical protein
VEYLHIPVTAVSVLIKSGQTEIGFLAHFIAAEEPELKEEYKERPQTSQDNVEQNNCCYYMSLFVCVYL